MQKQVIYKAASLFYKHERKLQQKHGITFLFRDNVRERETELVIDY